MSRVIKYWVALGTLAAITTYGGDALLFNQFDLSFVHFASVFCATLLQAAVLAWRMERPGDALASLARSIVRHPLAPPVLLLDVLLLGGGVVWWETRPVGLGAAIDIQRIWTLAKTAAAVVFFAAAVRRAGRGRRSALTRLIAAPVLLVFALEPSTSWLAAAFRQVVAVLGPRGEVFQRLAFYGVLYSLLIGLTLRSARRLEVLSREAGALLQAVVAAAVALAAIVVLASFNLPVVTQPWLGAAELAASAGATSALLAALFLATPDR